MCIKYAGWSNERVGMNPLRLQVTCPQHIACLQKLLTSLPQRKLTRASMPALVQLLCSKAGDIGDLIQAVCGPLQQVLASSNEHLQAAQVPRAVAQQLVDAGLVEALASFIGGSLCMQHDLAPCCTACLMLGGACMTLLLMLLASVRMCVAPL